MELELVLKGALPPIVAALVCVGLLGVRWLPLALSIGLFVAFGLLTRWNDWPMWPHELWAEPNGMKWLLWGAIAAALVALLEHARLWRGKVAAAAGVLAGAAAVWLMLQKVMVAGRWTNTDIALYIGGGGLLVGVCVLALRLVVARAPANVAMAVVASLLLSADSVLLTLARSALLGQLCGVAAAAVGAAAATSLWRRPFALTPADGTWLGCCHGLFLIAGVHFAELPSAAASCALPAPLAILLLRPGAAARPKVWTIAAVLLAGVPMAAAFWLLLQAGG